MGIDNRKIRVNPTTATCKSKPSFSTQPRGCPSVSDWTGVFLYLTKNSAL